MLSKPEKGEKTLQVIIMFTENWKPQHLSSMYYRPNVLQHPWFCTSNLAKNYTNFVVFFK